MMNFSMNAWEMISELCRIVVTEKSAVLNVTILPDEIQVELIPIVNNE